MPHPKAVIVLRALLAGDTIKIGKYSFVMNIEYQLCVPAKNLTTGKDTLLAVDFGGLTLQDFIYLCESATEDEIIVIGANRALNEIK